MQGAQGFRSLKQEMYVNFEMKVTEFYLCVLSLRRKGGRYVVVVVGWFGVVVRCLALQEPKP